MRILLVDDETYLVHNLTRYLTRKGHGVVSADNGEKGLSVFAAEPKQFDVVITDVKMPVMDGLEFLKRLRREDTEIPVIIMTGHGDLDVAVAALRFGAYDFLLKPFRLQDLDSSLVKLEALRANKKDIRALVPSVEESVRIAIPSRTSLIHTTIAYFSQRLDNACAYYREDATRMAICLQEAITNAIIHGNLEVESALKEESWDLFEKMLTEREADPAYAERRVTVEYLLEPWKVVGAAAAGSRLTFTVTDQGAGFNTKQLPNFDDPLSMLSSGRGLLLIHSCLDEVSWNASGNSITMRKILTRSEGDGGEASDAASAS